jgi:uncharacterized YigZ family protein
MSEINNDIYLVPASTTNTEIKVKGSKFISAVFPVSSKEEAETVYADIKKKYYDATHNCFAYRINANNFRYSDDGEPNGTAGKPILQIIDNKGMNEILCVVTRYFGGTKLGVGGLMRAYSDSAKLAIDQVEIKKKIRSRRIKISLNYDLENSVRKLLNTYNGKLEESNYSEHINMNILIPESKAAAFEREIIEMSSNSITIENT